ncbi:hypothetical protein [Sulfobacillus thermosulfidooxidans]|uniref:hypothetical protein n=1 Tax=Sulfobacillus thermosulfidooxidans TaxID=28034 RepID=UPI00096BBC60|nr:hypothetical protein [Sulfobacillus thermosulfidooxidans]OLZ11788.1 hypothetical protein BFX05_07315 [Sulfobacillus thermosulfidooxidans]OLZ17074.1 hypothetical protein BFX06_14160 [Sulfobacillus thermosulfidooxidans]OLZ20170.1 hypothetical protein BFX07_00890 [Sulfobacillus thermosulfidooxidans]
MRKRLQAMDEIRATFTATFKRFGQKPAFRGNPITTLLFVDVLDDQGQLVTDHIWFSLTKGFQQVHLEPGDRIQFEARVKEYLKGYRGYREDVRLEHPLVPDYKLSYPTKIRKIPPNSVSGKE